jgi:hypothetical protein
MAKDCLYCGLQFSDTTRFCPHCGRPTESGFTIRPLQEVELVRLRGERKGKDDLIRQLVLSLRFKSPAAQVHLSSIFSQKDVFEAPSAVPS